MDGKVLKQMEELNQIEEDEQPSYEELSELVPDDSQSSEQVHILYQAVAIIRESMEKVNIGQVVMCRPCS